jgi:hypothetical protein
MGTVPLGIGMKWDPTVLIALREKTLNPGRRSDLLAEPEDLWRSRLRSQHPNQDSEPDRKLTRIE